MDVEKQIDLETARLEISRAEEMLEWLRTQF